MRLGRQRTPSPPAPPVLCRWDLDKTYLRSDFDTLRSLLKTAFEKAEDKIDVPGVAELIKVIKAAGERHARDTRIVFVSASPPQIGNAIRKKLALDGLPYDGIVFKNQLAHLRRGKLRNLREHVGFKLAELLRGRVEAPAETRELLFGDDWESDSLIYSLYADVVAGRLGAERLAPVLRRVRVDPPLVDEVLALAGRAVAGDVVVRIFINLERRSPPAAFRLFGPRVVPTFNYFQTAVVLAADAYLDPEDVARVARVLIDGAGYTGRRLANSLDDLVRRAHLGVAAADAIARPLAAAGVVTSASTPRSRWRRAFLAVRRRVGRGRQTAETALSPLAGPLDYDAILDRLAPTAV